jgi:hypothetical protein
MTSELSSFSARLRERISLCESAGVGGWDSEPGGDRLFNSLALELFALQYAHNAPYRRLCDARGISPQSITHWANIPPVPTAGFKELELTCLAPAERTAVFHSSGTTAQRPSRHFHSAESLALYEASLWVWFRAYVLAGLRGAGVGEWRLAILTPRPTQAPHSSLVHMFETVRRRVGAAEDVFLGGLESDGTWNLDLTRTGSALRLAVAADRPVVLLGTAFSFVHLMDAVAERGLQLGLPPGSVVMETGGYKGRSRELPKPELHELICHGLGVSPLQIRCEYGMSELSSQAYDGTGSAGTETEARIFRFPPWCRAQTVSPETGREVAVGSTGLIRVFDLANVFSVLAVQTEDLAIRRADGFELLGRAVAAEPRGCSLMATEPGEL